ncbi:hypothetical protein A3B42_04775 [Candidatus Daviesbacteria bacterium RIFCSPLOWO2_01_FULL_38_10]|uniref:Polysaccharide biosynthesis protein n=1 Tax=Candidatus Daviesbacteria bacterium GW2011_GWF2_38_6 TaxID=1618432 RepID=A0A0G0KE10_9BACT|nr:MAG: Polysaccharide biosynthesis protein [Candidatus Daviesbacteria bacterium GW2011_GWF2_38_6]OGE39786.1 MAG: hypothetical protein A3B42_04775 [Candidatus Daviesbacteria bacterium RIFCSPLOWO2_01_FULL_38_10]OGE68687.1 MAG: hypothetical protein A3H81_00335 [Candidatus Daviesbacteria bacterium RIFCSPLOWO2_02_FULL_38_18]OGE72976.1 MAG: hypothetical protein A3H18_00215 [Candidatus Daviesbacteria bacterium RIFCSPLOWO2_12_FULL_38_10]HCB23189.1 hypothetical protein [Candidatus Daviesbacteria bacter
MEDLSVELVKNRAIKGAAILTVRNILIQAVSFFSIALLTFLLEPQDYGVFFIVSAVVSFLAYFGDIGFAASLIQKKEKLQDIELRTIFTAQQILVFSLVSIVFLLTPVIRNFYHFDNGAIYLLWALAFSLVLSSLKTIPTVLLERKLEFNKYIIPQILEVLVFNITAVFFAWRGFGVTSFTIAVILRGFVGLVSTYIVSPWIPRFAFSASSFKSLLKFGIPYQANTFLAMIKDDGMTLFLGGTLGSSGIGLLGWAQKWAFAPLRFFMDQVIKVTFPAFSRMQDNKKELSNALSKSIFYICLLVFPALTFLILVAPSLVEVIPKYSKWSPALLALSFLSITSALAAVATPLTNAFNAIGKISVTFKLMIMWTVLTWLFVPFLSSVFGVNGAAAGFALVGLSSVVVMFVALKYVEINYLKIVGKPLLVSVITGGVVLVIRSSLQVSWQQVAFMCAGGLVTYFTTVLILEPKLLIFLKIKKRNA